MQSKKLNSKEVGKILNFALKEKDFGKTAQRIGVLLWDKNNDGKIKDNLFGMGKRFIRSLINKKSK